MSEGTADRIRRLVEALNRLELQIAGETEVLKDQYVRAAAAMPEDKSYFLNGVQTSSVVKSYLLTRRGIECPGKEPSKYQSLSGASSGLQATRRERSRCLTTLWRTCRIFIP